MIFKCDSMEIKVDSQVDVRDIFPLNASEVFVIKQDPSLKKRSFFAVKVNIPERFDGDYYLRDDEDTYRLIPNVASGLSLPRSAKDGKIEFVKVRKIDTKEVKKVISITELQFEALQAGGSVSKVCSNLSLEDRRILATGLDTEELNKLSK